MTIQPYEEGLSSCSSVTSNTSYVFINLDTTCRTVDTPSPIISIIQTKVTRCCTPDTSDNRRYILPSRGYQSRVLQTLISQGLTSTAGRCQLNRESIEGHEHTRFVSRIAPQTRFHKRRTGRFYHSSTFQDAEPYCRGRGSSSKGLTGPRSPPIILSR